MLAYAYILFLLMFPSSSFGVLGQIGVSDPFNFCTEWKKWDVISATQMGNFSPNTIYWSLVLYLCHVLGGCFWVCLFLSLVLYVIHLYVSLCPFYLVLFRGLEVIIIYSLVLWYPQHLLFVLRIAFFYFHVNLRIILSGSNEQCNLNFYGNSIGCVINHMC